MYFTILIKSLLQVLCVLLFKAFFLYKILFTGMHYSSKYYKQAKNKPGETIVSDTIESSNQGQIINKIDCYHKFKNDINLLPNSLSIVFFQLHKQYNFPVEIIRKIVNNIEITQLKNIVFLSFYDNFIKVARLCDVFHTIYTPTYVCLNNVIELENDLHVVFDPMAPLLHYQGYLENENRIIIWDNKNKRFLCLTLHTFIPETQINQDTIITEIFNRMNQKVEDFHEYKKLSYTDLIFIDKTFNATTLEDITSILQWLPTIKSKKIEKIIWSLLMEKAGHFWNTVTINGKNFWDTKDKKYINYFIPKIQNRYALSETNRIPIPQHELMLILKTKENKDQKTIDTFTKRESFTTPETNIFGKISSFSVTFPHEKNPLYINQYPFPCAWVAYEN